MALYDRIGRTYAAIRREDPRLAAPIWAALGDARSVVNVGAGAGSYEPRDRDVTAVEPSEVMIAQRPPGAAPVVQATAEVLPFPDDSFDAAMAILTLHHWSDVEAGLAEMVRVARRRVVVVGFDRDLWDEQWIVRDYLPEIAATVLAPGLHPSLDRVLAALPPATVQPLLAPNDCTDRDPLGAARAVPRPAGASRDLDVGPAPAGGVGARPRSPSARPRVRRVGPPLRPPPHDAGTRRRPPPRPRRARRRPVLSGHVLVTVPWDSH